MKSLRFVGFLLAFCLPLCAQQQLNERQLGTYHGDDEAVRSAMNYCDAVDDSLQGRQPRIFAGLMDPATRSPSNWKTFADRDEWEAAGRPFPVAFVWDRDGAIVRVTIVSTRYRPGAPVAVRTRMNYCYGTDTKLVRIRALWSAPRRCEFLFPCRLIVGYEFVGGWPAVTDWVFTPDGSIQKLRNGKPEQNYFDPSYSLTADQLHLKTSADLPFDHLASK